jgi:hypothetical protein
MAITQAYRALQRRPASQANPMDVERFDHWTRTISAHLTRRTLAGALGLGALAVPGLTAAKKKRKHKKTCKHCGPCRSCKKGTCKPKADGTACSGGSCCSGVCSTEKQEVGSDCDQDSDCCSDYCRTSTFADDPVNTCAANCRGKACTTEDGCCRGFSCASGRCGGCKDFGAPCASDAECCFSACAAHVGQKQCLSFAGGPCAKDTDCWSCWLNEDCTVTVDGQPVAVCHDGVCGCPYACCLDVDCPPNQFCAVDLNGLNGHCEPIL